MVTNDGMLTDQDVTYEAELDLARKGDKIRMTGNLEIGGETIVLTMMKIEDLE